MRKICFKQSDSVQAKELEKKFFSIHFTITGGKNVSFFYVSFMPGCSICWFVTLNYGVLLPLMGRDVNTKISKCRVNTTSRWGIKQLGISFGFIFLLFPYESI